MIWGKTFYYSFQNLKNFSNTNSTILPESAHFMLAMKFVLWRVTFLFPVIVTKYPIYVELSRFHL